MFSNKVVLITGAAGALGRAASLHFLEAHAKVICLDYSMELLDAAFDNRVKEAGGSCQFMRCDLRSRESCQAVLGKLDRVDILANIAGGFQMGETVHDTSDETWDFLFELNSRSIINTTSVVVPKMLAQGGGKVINIAARAASHGAANMGAYTASKAAVIRLTESMALELRAKGINVNCIMPGTIDTERNRQDMPKADHGSWVPPKDIARVIAFLASDEAVAVHGASIAVDGLS